MLPESNIIAMKDEAQEDMITFCSYAFIDFTEQREALRRIKYFSKS